MRPNLSRNKPSISSRLMAPFLLGALLAAGHAGAAQPRAVYVISDHEGYGLVDCVAERRDCGKVVADSWCEAHGHGAALAYGRAEDLTASVGRTSTAPTDAAVVACAD